MFQASGSRVFWGGGKKKARSLQVVDTYFAFHPDHHSNEEMVVVLLSKSVQVVMSQSLEGREYPGRVKPG